MARSLVQSKQEISSVCEALGLGLAWAGAQEADCYALADDRRGFFLVQLLLRTAVINAVQNMQSQRNCACAKCVAAAAEAGAQPPSAAADAPLAAVANGGSTTSSSSSAAEKRQQQAAPKSEVAAVVEEVTGSVLHTPSSATFSSLGFVCMTLR